MSLRPNKRAALLGLISFCLAVQPLITKSEQAPLRLAGTHWCPYSCDYLPFPGFVTQYITALMEKNDRNVTVTIMDWGEAVARTQAGEFDGLITATSHEAPGLILTTTATDIYHSCFYTLDSEAWRYEPPLSLNQIKLGVIHNYSYGNPLDNWLADQRNSEHFYTSKEAAPLSDLVAKLRNKEIDAFIQDRYVLSHFLYRSNHKSTGIREAGCLSESPFYLAFNPNAPNIQQVIDYLNQHIDSDKNRQLKHYFKLRYGLGKYF